MPIDLGTIKAIDVHVHAEVLRTPGIKGATDRPVAPD